MARKAKKSSEPGFSKNRKIEVIGFVTMALSVLVGLSVFTYNSADDALIREFGFSDITSMESAGARVMNALGPLGAYLSYLLVNILFGYFSIFIAVLGLMYGWHIMRHHTLENLHKRSLYYTLLMIVLSTVFGWFHILTDAALSAAWAGVIGVGFAKGLIALTAYWGSGIILFSLLVVMILLVVGGSMQAVIENIKDGWERYQENMEKWREQRKENARLRAQKYKEERERIRRQTADEQMKKKVQVRKAEENAEPAESPEERRIRLRKEEEDELAKRPPRAVIETMPDDGSDDATTDTDEDDTGPEIKVYKGAGEEEADAEDLERAQETKGKKIIKYRFPGIDLLDSPPNEGNEIDIDEINQNKEIILDKLGRHGIEILAIEAVVGPTVTLYELQPAPDVKISKIEGYANDLKMAMATHGLRIIAPIPGKSAVGIEVPNRKRETVYIKQVINTKKFVDTDMTLPVAFGKTIENEVFMVDLAKLPHVLLAGATGAGKSVGINTVITCLLYKCHPEDLKFVLIDPKKIELALYRNIQNHFLATLPDLEEPIITDTSRVQEVLNSVCKEMDERYELLKMAMVREIKAYNAKFDTGELEDELGHRHLPYIIVIIDEMADLMITAGKGIEEPIARIAQLARAVGIHLVVATQRPSVNVITGTIKANFPARIAYRVASKVDSRTILDTIGADQLVGRGDMLFTGGSGMIRVQNAFVSTDEVERINAFIGNQMGYNSPFYLPKIEEEGASAGGALDKSERDELFEEAAKVVILHQQGSVSLLQRKLKLGYNRAGRIIDQLFMAGIVGPYQGSTARDVLIETEEDLQELLNELDG